jgi:hypothetical protein
MKFNLSLALLFPIFLLVTASPTNIKEDYNDCDLPLLKLPYGTWQASKYDLAADVKSPVSVLE